MQPGRDKYQSLHVPPHQEEYGDHLARNEILV